MRRQPLYISYAYFMQWKSMQYKQLDFFPETEEEKQNKEIDRLKKEMEKMRKGHFARGNAFKKELDDLRNLYETLILAVCKNAKENTLFLQR